MMISSLNIISQNKEKMMYSSTVKVTTLSIRNKTINFWGKGAILLSKGRIVENETFIRMELAKTLLLLSNIFPKTNNMCHVG